MKGLKQEATIDAFHLERLVRSVLAKKQQNPYMKPPYRKKKIDGIINFLELGQKVFRQNPHSIRFIMYCVEEAAANSRSFVQ